MAFLLGVHLLEAAYQAATPGRERAEWPPHPARLFCALVSVADPADPVHDAALRWLEEQPPPLVRVPAMTAEAVSPRAAWVPTNAAVTAKGKAPTHGVLPGRTNGGDPKRWPQRSLSSPELAFVWEAEPPDGVRRVLESLARAVPYLGRASGPALVHAAVVPFPGADEVAGTDSPARTDSAAGTNGAGWAVWGPARSAAGGGRALRVAYPGYLERLRTAYEAGSPAWQQARSHLYVPLAGPDAAPRALAAGEGVEEEVVPGPFEDLVTFALDRGVSVDPGVTLAVAGALRAKIMAMLDELGHEVTAMAAVNGHTDSDRERPCAFLGLPFVGVARADGRLRGVAVALPRGMEARQRKALLAALLRPGIGLRRLAVPGFARPARLTYVGPAADAAAGRWTVHPRTWTRPSRTWSTALPMVLDRFPKRNGRGIEASVAVSCRMAGLPEPVEVEVMRRGSLLPGAHELPARALRRRPDEPPLPGRHVRLRFAQPVSGPVVIGSKRNFGLGLCLPVDERAGGWRR